MAISSTSPMTKSTCERARSAWLSKWPERRRARTMTRRPMRTISCPRRESGTDPGRGRRLARAGRTAPRPAAARARRAHHLASSVASRTSCRLSSACSVFMLWAAWSLPQMTRRPGTRQSLFTRWAIARRGCTPHRLRRRSRLSTRWRSAVRTPSTRRTLSMTWTTWTASMTSISMRRSSRQGGCGIRIESLCDRRYPKARHLCSLSNLLRAMARRRKAGRRRRRGRRSSISSVRQWPSSLTRARKRK
mmetsp:Transcript_10472/g.43303  ORF Transcript_10472/g.43303 Transcript_10472/m.43303 type:complete len:248 (+) Transcript_10472:1461-2204(+)